MVSIMRQSVYMERDSGESKYNIKRIEDLLTNKTKDVFINKLFTDLSFTLCVSLTDEQDVKYEIKCKMLNNIYFKTKDKV